jgi:hypothetical protein
MNHSDFHREGGENSNENIPALQSFLVGDEVDVASRTTPGIALWSTYFFIITTYFFIIGINKPGGAARIRSITPEGLYCVTYILGGREDNLHIQYITRREECQGRPTRKRPAVTDLKTPEPASAPAPAKKPRKVLQKISPNISESSSRQKAPPLLPRVKQSTQKVRTPVVPPVETLDNDSISGESMNSPPTHQKPVVHSENTKPLPLPPTKIAQPPVVSEKTEIIIRDLTKGIQGIKEKRLPFLVNESCRYAQDEGYLVSDLKQFFAEKLGTDISVDFEMALNHFESRNILWSGPDSQSRRVVAIVD